MKNILFILLFFISQSVFSGNTKPDGNFWEKLSTIEKQTYVLGLYDGMELEKLFLQAKYYNTPKLNSEIQESFDETYRQYLEKPKIGQFVEGINTFFSDYRNRLIPIQGAWLIVAKSIAGEPEDEINNSIQELRRISATSK